MPEKKQKQQKKKQKNILGLSNVLNHDKKEKIKKIMHADILKNKTEATEKSYESAEEDYENQEGKLESVLKSKVMPLVESAVHKFLGVSISELNKDLTEKLSKNPLVEFDINTSFSFKKAKKIFKVQFLKKLLLLNYGNISETARIANVDRRSIHRIISEEEVKKIREEMIKPYEIKQKAVSSAIEGVLEGYKMVIHPEALAKMYENVGELSKDILDELPLKEMTLEQAEEEFEKQYLQKALDEAKGNIALAARRIKLRYETLHRKLKKLGLIR